MNTQRFLNSVYHDYSALMNHNFKLIIIKLHDKVDSNSFIKHRIHRDWLIDLMYESMVNYNHDDDQTINYLYNAIVEIQTLTD